MTKRKKQLLWVGLGGVALVGVMLAAGTAKASDETEELEGDEPEDEFDAVSPGIDVPPEFKGEVPEVTIDVPAPSAPDQPEDIDVVLPEVPEEVLEDIPVKLPKPPKVEVKIPVPEVGPPVAVPRPPVTVPQPAPAPQLPGIPPGLPPETANMLAVLLPAERAPGWKRVEPTVKVWQRARNLTADGKFGPGSALKLALEAGTIPIVRFWPASAGPRPDLALADYQAALLEIAQAMPPDHAELLRRSADREEGQSFGPPQGSSGKLPISEVFA